MLDITKVLVISNELSEYENIKNILEPLKAFELSYGNSLERSDYCYDIVIADLDLFNDFSETEIFEKLKQVNNKVSIIFMKSIKNSNSIKELEGINILAKPVRESRLIECIYQTILEDLSEILK